ncbi:energy transducer TonB [Sphingopyxis panaciterrulae]|uniref:Protein TonB n=1 Tax=Sphingopyxis panaciterrulae TaxID=462372 RepID=A0A7W9B7X9_9SPHN|nr:energy transducer TonB [Sphingopyxis panaciterrulae]MBB5707919.1 protein TonB [Sphingopyxis panaciterrulae]
MAYTGQLPRRQRMIAGGGALIAALLVGIGLASGLDLNVVRTAAESISAFAIPAPPPPESPRPVERTPDSKAGKAAPPNERTKAVPAVAPKPKLPVPDPALPAAPHPGTGREASAGATPTPGRGSGAGGRGDGTGSGGAGSGTGGGTRPVLVSGRIEDRDYPRQAARAKSGGEVEVRFTIQPTGRVTGCRVTRSSGDAVLDATTCRLIEDRFRFRPATNAADEAVASAYGWRQNWWLERRR